MNDLSLELPKWANERQKETAEMLASVIEGLDFASKYDEFDGAIVFEGDGSDGPAVGYIETDGKVTWICG